VDCPNDSKTALGGHGAGVSGVNAAGTGGAAGGYGRPGVNGSNGSTGPPNAVVAAPGCTAPDLQGDVEPAGCGGYGGSADQATPAQPGHDGLVLITPIS
jgi:hypothetical protein